MKLKNLLWCCLMLLAFPLTASADLVGLEGAGSAESPYLISSCADWIIAAQNATDEHYFLTQSLDCSEIDTPNAVIFKNAFEGNFDGNFNVITVNINDGGVDDLSYLEGEDNSLFGAFGLFRFFKDGEISNLGVTGDFNITSVFEGGQFQYIDVGGMVGSMGYLETNPILTNVFSNVNINTVDGVYVGGLVGYLNGGEIHKSYVGNVDVDSQSTVGGFIGLFDAGLIKDSYTRASVTSTIASTGGFVASMTGGSIENSFAEGGTINAVADGAGGFVGIFANGSIEKSFSSNSVTGDKFVGGFVGLAFGGTISDSYSFSSATGNDMVGGFVASMGRDGQPGNASISRSYATGASIGALNAGGFAGVLVGGTIDESYYNTDTTSQTYSAGPGVTALTDEEFKDPTKFEGFDMTEVWSTYTDTSNGFFVATLNGYPYLRVFEDELSAREGVINITANSATIVGDVFTNIETDSTYNFLLAKSSDEVNFANFDPELVTVSETISPQFNLGLYSYDFTGLDCGTSYDFVFFPATNIFGPIDYDNVYSFETSACPVVEEVRSGGGGSGSRAKPKSLSYEEEVANAVEIELITKDPLAQVNKCEALTMMSRAFEWEVPAVSVKSQFSDVPDWCQSVADFAFERGVVKGRESNILGLDSPMSRYEMAVMVHRELLTQNFDFNSSKSVPEFSDNLVDWAKLQVLELAKSEFVKGFSDGSFGGQSPVIKQDFAVVLLRAM